MIKQFCHIPASLSVTVAEFFNSDYAKQLGVSNVTSDPKLLNTIMTTICCLLEPAKVLCNNFTINFGVLPPNPTKKYTLVQLKKPENIGFTLTGGFRAKELIEKCRTKLKVIMASTGHPDGECADITRAPWSNLKLFCVLKALQEAGYLEFDQLIYEYDTNCCHAGYRAGANRKQVMTRKVVNGEFVYTNV